MGLRLAIGVDVGATKIAAVLADENGRVLQERRHLTEAGRGATAVIHTTGSLIQELLADAPAPVAGIGIDTPGRVDPEAGIVYGAANLGWEETHLVRELQNYLALTPPIFVIRDAYAELLGEFYFGAGQGCRDLVYLGLGSGLGGGVMSDGRLLTGATLNASEIGHLSLDVDGRLCRCGLFGCAETVVSGNGVLATAKAWLRENKWPTTLIDAPLLSAKDVVLAAREGDELATAVIRKAARWLGQIIAAYAVILNPARIIIGGGFGKAAFDLLLPETTQELKRRALRMNLEQLEILPSSLASSALGASCLVWHSDRGLS
jgi:glucokinase